MVPRNSKPRNPIQIEAVRLIRIQSIERLPQPGTVAVTLEVEHPEDGKKSIQIVASCHALLGFRSFRQAAFRLGFLLAQTTTRAEWNSMVEAILATRNGMLE